MSVSFRNVQKLPEEMNYYELITKRNTPGIQQQLKEATVGIAGLGGLGSNVAVQLARSGVGRMVLADFDIVDPTNLNRQNYYLRHIGMKKSEAIKDVLLQINPYIELICHDVYLDQRNILEIFKDVNVLVEAFDQAENKSVILNEWLSQSQAKPIVCASGMGGTGTSNSIRTRRVGQRIYLAGDLKSEVTTETGVMAPRVAMTAAHQSNAVLRLLLNQTEV